MGLAKGFLRKRIEERVQKLKKEVEETINREIGPAMIEAAKLTWEHYDPKIQELFRNAVQAFYDDYQPKSYGRAGTLYKILETTIASPKYILNEQEEIVVHRGVNLYAHVYEQGWHGGAMAPDGVYRYRTGLNFEAWGDPATRAAESPHDAFWREYYSLRNGELQDFFGQKVRECLAKRLPYNATFS